MAYKSMDDKQGNHSPEGVIIELQTNDGNKLQELIIIPYPPEGSEENTHSWCLDSFKLM